jgi:hypothetical protein
MWRAIGYMSAVASPSWWGLGKGARTAILIHIDVSPGCDYNNNK